jgi:hypothetical protein
MLAIALALLLSGISVGVTVTKIENRRIGLVTTGACIIGIFWTLCYTKALARCPSPTDMFCWFARLSFPISLAFALTIGASATLFLHMGYQRRVGPSVNIRVPENPNRSWVPDWGRHISGLDWAYLQVEARLLTARDAIAWMTVDGRRHKLVWVTSEGVSGIQTLHKGHVYDLRFAIRYSSASGNAHVLDGHTLLNGICYVTDEAFFMHELPESPGTILEISRPYRIDVTVQFHTGEKIRGSFCLFAPGGGPITLGVWRS